MSELEALEPGEIGWVCRCGIFPMHPLLKGSWTPAADVCPKRLPAYRMHPEQVSERVSLSVDRRSPHRQAEGALR